MPPIEIRVFTPEDWRELRDLRLAALAEAPHAFGSTLAREQAFEEHDWRARLTNGSLAIYALVDGERAALAGGLQPSIDHGDRTAAWLVSMWTHPSSRGRGVGAALVERVIEWARAERFPELRLWVSEGNDDAELLYVRLGFSRTGVLRPIREGEPRLEAEMVLALATAPPM